MQIRANALKLESIIYESLIFGASALFQDLVGASNLVAEQLNTHLNPNIMNHLKRAIIMATLILGLGSLGLAQTDLDVKTEKIKLSKKGNKKGRFAGTVANNDSSMFYTFYVYQPKRKSPQLFDVVKYNASGKNLGFETIDLSTNIFTKYDIPLPEDSVSNKGFSPGQIVQIGGYNMFARKGYLEGGTWSPDYSQHDKIRFAGKEMKVEPCFVNPYKSELLPYYQYLNISKNSVIAEALSSPTHAIVWEGEDVLIGGIPNGRVDLSEVNPYFSRTRFLAGVYDTKKMDFKTKHMHEFEYSIGQSIGHVFLSDGGVKVYLEAFIREEPNEVVSKLDRKNPVLIVLHLDKEGALLNKTISKTMLSGVKVISSDMSVLQNEELSAIAGFKTGKLDRPSELFVVIMGDSDVEKTYSIEELENKLVEIPKNKNKVKINRINTNVTYESIKRLKNNDIVVVGTTDVKGGIDVRVHGKQVGTNGKKRYFILHINGETRDLKHYYELDPIDEKTITNHWQPQIEEDNSGNFYVYFTGYSFGMNEGAWAAGDKQWTLTNDYNYGKLLKINSTDGSVAKPYEHTKIYSAGYQPLVVTKEGVVLIDMVKKYFPKGKTGPMKVIIK